MSLTERLSELAHDCYTGNRSESHEREAALAEVDRLGREQSRRPVA